jgi:uncharacterized Tic20 family protein
MKTIPSTEERVWAVLAHLSALAFGMGLLIPIVGWSDQRRKSNYAAFQALQALGYQSLGYTFWFIAYLLMMVLFIIVLIVFGAVSGDNRAAVDVFMPIVMTGLFILIFASFGIYLLLPVVAAIACALGRDFRYPLMGNWLARYLGYDPGRATAEPVWLREENESRWVAAMGHFSVIITLWGLLAPGAALIVAGARSRFLKFQSIQTLIYQAVVTVLFVAGIIMYVGGALAGMGIVTGASGPTLETPLGLLGVAVLLLGFCCISAIMLAVPLFHLLGQWAGYRVLKGDDYKYLLVGRWTEKWFMKSDDSHL